MRQCRSRYAPIAAVLLLVVGGASAADASVRVTGSRWEPEESHRDPTLVVRAEAHDGVENGIVFDEDVDTVSVTGLSARSAGRIDRALGDYLMLSHRRFTAGLDARSGQTGTAPFNLTVRAIGTSATQRLISVVFQTTMESASLAHPFSWFDAFNFDRKGRSLSLSELLRPSGVEGIAAAASPVLAQLLAQRGNPGCRSDARSIAGLFMASEDQTSAHLGFTRSGALVTIDDYALGYYACGDATITLPYRAIFGSVRPRYLPQPRPTGPDEAGLRV